MPENAVGLWMYRRKRPAPYPCKNVVFKEGKK